jgi:predicted Zn-dependent protease
MTGKTPRMIQIEALLQDDPNDAFLRYGLAMEYDGAGDSETAVRMFRELIALDPAKPYVPAFHMGAQTLLKLRRTTEAIEILRQGIAAAQAQGNLHAAGEMQGLLDTLD